jgi:hypothetical protein
MRAHPRKTLERLDLGVEQEWPLGVVAPYTAPDPVTVANFMPAGFDRYVRILHPFVGEDPAVRRTWASLAAEFGLTYHPAISPASFAPFLEFRVDPESVPVDTTSDEGRWILDGHNVTFLTLWPDQGTLVDPARSRLLELLAHAAEGTPTFFYWGLALVVAGERPCLLLGSIESFVGDEPSVVVEHGLEGVPGPEMIWPEDRSFLVVTDYGDSSTYVCCSSTLGDRLIADDILEAVDTHIGARVDWRSDETNLPSPPRPTR